MRTSNSLENKAFSDTLMNSASMYENSGLQFLRTITGIQSKSDGFDVNQGSL